MLLAHLFLKRHKCDVQWCLVFYMGTCRKDSTSLAVHSNNNSSIPSHLLPASAVPARPTGAELRATAHLLCNAHPHHSKGGVQHLKKSMIKSKCFFLKLRWTYIEVVSRWPFPSVDRIRAFRIGRATAGFVFWSSISWPLILRPVFKDTPSRQFICPVLSTLTQLRRREWFIISTSSVYLKIS